uniref:Paralemmin n=1 Tax=Echeneis naucrates TaxID=173247 RepID=A0A665TF95_ECHNA
VSQALCQQDRLQLIAEKRKWQTEVENKKRQLEDDRRALQHLKSKALRERWLLDGAPSAGPEQEQVRRQLEQDEVKTRNLEETINRLEQELVSLEDEAVYQTVTQITVSILKHTLVHEMNGEDAIHLLSSFEVDELIHKADEASVMSQTVATVTSLPSAEVQEEAAPKTLESELPLITGEITGLEATPHSEPSVAEASAENPVTMVFMGYQSVEDESETKKVLGLQGIVTAELVLIDDTNGNGKTSPDPREKEDARAQVVGEAGEEAGSRVVEVKKERQLCKCCSIM